jgi:hypothetical protein
MENVLCTATGRLTKGRCGSPERNAGSYNTLNNNRVGGMSEEGKVSG